MRNNISSLSSHQVYYKSQSPGFPRAGEIDHSPFENDLIEANEKLIKLVRIHFILRTDTVDFIIKLPERLRRIRIATKKTNRTVDGQVQGKINWARTMQLRCISYPCDATHFVIERNIKNYDIPENLVLKVLLSFLHSIILDDLIPALAKKDTDPYLRSLVSQKGLNDVVINSFLDNVHVRRMLPIEKIAITQKMISKSLRSRHPLYREATLLYKSYSNLFQTLKEHEDPAESVESIPEVPEIPSRKEMKEEFPTEEKEEGEEEEEAPYEEPGEIKPDELGVPQGEQRDEVFSNEEVEEAPKEEFTEIKPDELEGTSGEQSDEEATNEKVEPEPEEFVEIQPDELEVPTGEQSDDMFSNEEVEPEPEEFEGIQPEELEVPPEELKDQESLIEGTDIEPKESWEPTTEKPEIPIEEKTSPPELVPEEDVMQDVIPPSKQITREESKIKKLRDELKTLRSTLDDEWWDYRNENKKDQGDSPKKNNE